MKKQAKCPNCESFKTRPALNDEGALSVIGKIIAAGGCLSIIPALIFPPLLLLSFLVMAIGAGITNANDLLDGVVRLQCRTCGIKFTVKKA